jgi:hypothetical protein
VLSMLLNEYTNDSTIEIRVLGTYIENRRSTQHFSDGRPHFNLLHRDQAAPAHGAGITSELQRVWIRR